MIDLTKLGDSPVAVLGIGVTGRTTVAALRASDITVYAWDDSDAGRAAADGLGAVVHELSDDVLSQCRFLVVAAGIPVHHKAHPVVARARELGLRIVCDVDLLWRMAPEVTYVAITGTNGKSTTTALIGHVLRACGRRIALGGNEQIPALGIDMFTSKDDIYILELSSYQLELCPAARFDHAVFLNLTPDHQERYASHEDYGKAKCNILRPRQDKGRAQTAVIGLDSPETAQVFAEQSGLTARQFIPISGQERCLSGISVVGRVLYDDIHNLRFDLTAARTLPGPHNGQNAAAAYAVCLQLGLKPAEIVFSILNFPGLAHRQQYVTTIGGVDIVNDSKATNVDAATKALACYDNIYWIAGGEPKSSDFSGLAPFTDRIHGAYLIGQAADAMAEWCRANSVACTRSGTLQQALTDALRDATQDRRRPVTVLLSPACASFDQFKSFEDRGEQFIKMAQVMKDTSL